MYYTCWWHVEPVLQSYPTSKLVSLPCNKHPFRDSSNSRTRIPKAAFNKFFVPRSKTLNLAVYPCRRIQYPSWQHSVPLTQRPCSPWARCRT